MFEKVSQAAERVATNVSRRAFLGRLGQGALATAGVVAATLAFGGKARAAPGKRCGKYHCPAGANCCYVVGLAGSERCCYPGIGTCQTGGGLICF